MSGQLAGRTILVVEDEPIIAMDIVAGLRAAGASVTEARTLGDALTLVECPGLSAAVLDHGLNDGDSSAVCRRLDERGIPFVVYTGYTSLAGPCSEGEQIRKPVHPNALVAAIAQALESERAGQRHH
jgi:CheY-like chemotaxis protein